MEFYYGLSRDYETQIDSCLSISELGENILRSSISGNFRGSDVTVVSPEKKAEIFRQIGQKRMSCAARVEGVPGSVKDDERFQSVDRLVDVMRGEPFALLVIAKALTSEETERVEKDIYEAYARLSPAAKISTQESYSVGSSQGESLTEGFSESGSNSYADTKNSTRESSSSRQESDSTGFSESYEASTSSNDSLSWQDGVNEGHSWSVSRERLQRGVQEWLKYCDDVILAGYDVSQEETASQVIETFREFIRENRDEITALRIIYDQRYKDRPMAIAKLKALYEKLKARNITVDRLWDCCAIKRPDKVKRGTVVQLTDLVSLIRFEAGAAETLAPFAERVSYNFQQWSFRRNAGAVHFTDEQMEWLRLIKDHIAASLSVVPEDLDLSPFDRKGGLGRFYEVFGEDYEKILMKLNVELVA